MSLHCSVICIRGSHLPKIEGLLAQLNYRHVGSPASCSSASLLSEALYEPTDHRNIVRKAAYESDGWTYLIDPEMVVMIEDERLEAFAREHSTQILVWICEGFSGTYGIRLFAPELRRDVMRVGKSVSTDVGERLPEESGIDWASASEDDVLTVAQRLGAPYDYLSEDREYLIYTLDESHLPEPDLAALENAPPLFGPDDIVVRVVGRVPVANKPWWKFW